MELPDAAKSVFTQLAYVLEQISDEEYNREIPLLGNSTLGQHVRHTLEFFICLQAGMVMGIINAKGILSLKQIRPKRWM